MCVCVCVCARVCMCVCFGMKWMGIVLVCVVNVLGLHVVCMMA